MAKSPDLSPRIMAPFFWITGLFHLAAVISRFPDLALLLPAGLSTAILVAHLPLILVEGYFEGRLDYGPKVVQLPLWMRIDSRAVKLTFTFAFVYLCVVVFQTWDINLGPVDFSPPAEWPLAQRAGWFALFTVGFAFPNYLAAMGFFLPALRVITAPLRSLPALISVLLLVAFGGAVAWFGLEHVPFPEISAHVAAWKARFEADPYLSTLITVGVPLIFGALAAIFGKRKEP